MLRVTLNRHVHVSGDFYTGPSLKGIRIANQRCIPTRGSGGSFSFFFPFFFYRRIVDLYRRDRMIDLFILFPLRPRLKNDGIEYLQVFVSSISSFKDGKIIEWRIECDRYFFIFV